MFACFPPESGIRPALMQNRHYRLRFQPVGAAAWDRAHRPKTCKLAGNRELARIVVNQLQLEWSPRQIAGWLKRT